MKKQNKGYIHAMCLSIPLILVSFSHHVSGQDDFDVGIRNFESQNYYGAKLFFEDYLKNNPGSAKAHYFLGRTLYNQNETDPAMKSFEAAVGIQGDEPEYLTWLGITYINKLNTDDYMQLGYYAPKALSILERAVGLDSTNILARQYLAGYYANAPSFVGGSPEKAEEQFAAIFRLDPDHTGSWYQKGEIAAQNSDTEEAIKCFNRVVALEPMNLYAHLWLGKLYGSENSEAAKAEYHLQLCIENTLEGFNEKDEAWWELGRLYESQGNKREATQAYEKALELDPENQKYRQSLKNLKGT